MEIIIGGDHSTLRLKLTITGQPKPKLAGQQGSCPLSVSRQHCSLTTCPDGGYILANLNPRNVTYVNGMPIMSQRITEYDRIELGRDRYLLDWAILKKVLPKPELHVDITPLEDIWNTYYQTTNRMQVKEKRFNAMRGIIPVITMGAMAAIFLIGPSKDGKQSPLQIAAYALAALLALFFFIKSFIDASKITNQREELKQWFMTYYRCPNPECNRFLGYTDFTLVAEQDCCPKCKAKYDYYGSDYADG